MHKIFTALLKSIAALFAALFVLAAVLTSLLLNFEHTFLNAAAYKRALNSNRVYQQLPALFAAQYSSLETFLADPCAGNELGCAIDGASPELQNCLTGALGPQAYQEIGSGRRKPDEAELQAGQLCLDQYPRESSEPRPEGGPPGFFSNLDAHQWQELIAYLLPADDLQRMTEAALDQTFAYLNGQTDSATISLAPLKARLSGQAGRDFILLLLNAQPPCTTEQQAQIEAGDFGGEGKPPVLCAATGATLDKLLPELQRQLDEAVVRIPDEATLIKPPSPSSPSHGPLGDDPVSALRLIRRGLHLSPLLPLVLLLLVTLFAVRSLKGWLRWWGIPMLTAGFILLSIGIACRPVLDWAWVHYVAARIPTMASASLTELGQNLARFMLNELAKGIMLTGGLLALAGLGAIVGSNYIQPRRDPVLMPEPPPGTPGGRVV